MRAILLSFVVASTAAAQDGWTGQKFMPKAKIKIQSGIASQQIKELPLVVTEVKGDRLKVGSAFLQKDEVVPLHEAIRYYTDYLREHPDTWWAYNYRAVAWHAQGNLENAIADFGEVIRIVPKDKAGYKCRAIVWCERNHWDNALKDIDQLLQLYPKDAFSWVLHGICLQNKGNLDGAFQDYTHAIRLDSKLSAAYRSRGELSRVTNRYDHALADFKQAIQLAPNHSEAYNNRAWLYATAQNPAYRNGKKAIEDATRACELTEWKNCSSLDTLASAYAEAGDFQKAVDFQLRAIDHASEASKHLLLSHLDLYRAGRPCAE